MAEIVNLNKTRKTLKKAEDKARADANAVRFGRTKAQRMLEAARAEQARKHLDQLKFEDE